MAAKITDADFAKTVLEPCGIIIQNMGVNKNLHKHFRIQEQDLPPKPKDRLEAYRKRYTLDVWLESDTERIQREYKSMEVYGCNEAEHSAYVLRDIFLDEPRHPWLPEQAGDQRWLPVRMLQLVQKLFISTGVIGLQFQDGTSCYSRSAGSRPDLRYDIRRKCLAWLHPRAETAARYCNTCASTRTMTMRRESR